MSRTFSDSCRPGAWRCRGAKKRRPQCNERNRPWCRTGAQNQRRRVRWQWASRRRQYLQPAIVTGHEAVEQGRIEAVQVGDGVGDAEGGLEIEMQGAVAKRGQIHQRGAVVNRLQSQGEIDGDGGRAAATFGVHNREHLAARIFTAGLRRVESGERRLPADRWWWWGARCTLAHRPAWR